MRKVVILIAVIVSLWEVRAQQNDVKYRLQTRKEVYAEINRFRVQNGLPELKPLKRLEMKAGMYALYCSITMRDHECIHANLRVGGKFTIVCELLACFNYRPVEAWIESKPHRVELLNKRYTYMGVARSGSRYVLRMAG